MLKKVFRKNCLVETLPDSISQKLSGRVS